MTDATKKPMLVRAMEVFNTYYRVIMFAMAAGILINLQEANENADAARVNAARTLDSSNKAQLYAQDAAEEAKRAYLTALSCEK